MTAAAFVGAVGALLAGVLLCAGMATLAVPAHLSRGIGDLFPAARARAVPLARAVAVIELATALALSIPAVRGVGAVAGLVLGAALAAAGVVAATRTSGSPGGWFGRAASRPPGVRDLALGLVLAVLSALLWRDGSDGWAAHRELPVLVAAAVAVVLAGWLYRDMIRDLCRPLGLPARRVPR